MKKIAITGHRPSKLNNDYSLTSLLIKRIRSEIELIIANEQPDYLISGMALGIDTLFAKIAMFMDIPLIAAIPCKNQDKMWTRESQCLYNKILNHPNTEIHMVTNKEYNNYCMQLRNQWMVDNCDLLIAVWNGTSGGTSNCIKYAVQKNKHIIYINPKNLLSN